MASASANLQRPGRGLRSGGESRARAQRGVPLFNPRTPGFGSGLRSSYRDGAGLSLRLAGGMHWIIGAAAVLLLGAFWGYAVAMTHVNALLLCVSLLACIFIFLDFRIGVVLLVLLMPISA